MSVTKPKLPPKKGYVEIVENGVHKYKPVPATLQMEELKEKLAETSEALELILSGVTEDEA